MKNKVTRRQNVKNKVTKSYIRQLVKEALQETTFVDPEGRAVDLSSDKLSPRQRVQNKYYDLIRNHPNKEFREKAEKVRLKSLGVPQQASNPKSEMWVRDPGHTPQPHSSEVTSNCH